MRMIRGGLEFVLTVENLQGLARGIPIVREVRDWDGQPVVLRVSVSANRWRGFRVELWGAREYDREEAWRAKKVERQLRAAVEHALPEGN